MYYAGDGTLRIWNSHVPQRATMTLRAHDAEVLSCDWCKYDQNILATGGSDGLIRGWDLRSFSAPVFEQKVFNLFHYMDHKPFTKTI